MESNSNYRPLLVILALVALASLALESGEAMMRFDSWMERFMGLFFVVFAMFKLFDLKGFADGFQMYDLVAKRWRAYAYVYPYIELALGLAYLSACCLWTTNLLTVIVMLISGAGVVRSIRSGMNLQCACLGTLLKVPLSTVSVVENFGMGAMAALMLIL